jgi:EAL domain-containing protein (putative c-di-GMP-specific phosphodiesterase class I)
MPAGFRRIQMAVVVFGGLAVGAILLIGLRRGARKPRVAVPMVQKAPPRAVPLYRPVIEIEIGEIVGADVVLNPGAVFDAGALDQVLTEMTPVLRAQPGLMLSLPSVSSAAALNQIVTVLVQLMSRQGTNARQVVLTALPRAASTETIGAIRASGARLALNGVLSSDGGLMALATQSPDFITFSGEVLGGERELAILHAAAGIARKFDIGVVVREVELPEHLEWLRAVGVTTATGPAFGHALNARSIGELAAAAARGGVEAKVA